MLLPENAVLLAAGHLRMHAGQKYNDRHQLLDPKDFRFLWVVDFPMFEWDEKRIVGMRRIIRLLRCMMRIWRSLLPIRRIAGRSLMMSC